MGASQGWAGPWVGTQGTSEPSRAGPGCWDTLPWAAEAPQHRDGCISPGVPSPGLASPQEAKAQGDSLSPVLWLKSWGHHRGHPICLCPQTPSVGRAGWELAGVGAKPVSLLAGAGVGGLGAGKCRGPFSGAGRGWQGRGSARPTRCPHPGMLAEGTRCREGHI